MCLGGWQGFEGTLLAVQSHAFGETCLTTPEEANSSAKVLKIHVELVWVTGVHVGQQPLQEQFSPPLPSCHIW